MYLDHNFGLRLSPSESLSPNFEVRDSLSEISLLFDLSLDLDRTLAQWNAKSKVKATHCHWQLIQ